ncbi:MAG: ABC transporter ATP-binding protein [Acidobacteria bacterium]|nr:ABC transporter ATP-binding protein [Acidobacteriota bacterium]MCZ6877984.1 ABC transporter ATP-binding protein [Acidobacteriota bacterium]
MMTRENTILRLQNVSRIYHQGDETIRALDDVSLTLQQGEFVAIAGPSGSGKTTLLNVAVGLDQPTQGKVWIEGQDLTRMKGPELARLRLHEVGFIFQAYNLVPVLSAEENTELILLLRGVPVAERRRAVRQVLKEVGLEGLEERRPSQLSGGQQQRVAVARAIVAEPALVLADEPTANLDSETAFALMGLLEKLNQEHATTFLFSTHDPRVMKRARRIIHLVDGHVERDESQPSG